MKIDYMPHTAGVAGDKDTLQITAYTNVNELLGTSVVFTININVNTPPFLKTFSYSIDEKTDSIFFLPYKHQYFGDVSFSFFLFVFTYQEWRVE